MTRFLLFVLCSLISLSPAQAVEPELWQKLRAFEAVALVRHALAPGTGDPANFVVSDCNTQRNLSQEGRRQAERMGELFKVNGVTHANVFSSQWCRCIDTANGFDLGEAQPLPFLNSFFQDRSSASDQTSQLKQWIEARLKSTGADNRVPAILVSHQVNITALTGVYPASGEIVFVGYAAGKVEVLGTIETY